MPFSNASLTHHDTLTVAAPVDQHWFPVVLGNKGGKAQALAIGDHSDALQHVGNKKPGAD